MLTLTSSVNSGYILYIHISQTSRSIQFVRIKMSVIVFAAIGFSIYLFYKKWFKTDIDHSTQEVRTRIVRSQEECSAAIRMIKSYVM